jgi:hypothetical protein
MDYADIREGIHDHLCNCVAGIDDASSPPVCKVFDEWTAPADTEKPFLEMAFLGEIPTVNRSKCAHHMQLEVLVMGEEYNIIAIDPIADNVVSCLHHQSVVCPSGARYEPQYIQDSRMDGHNQQLNASVIRLLFWIPVPFTT